MNRSKLLHLSFGLSKSLSSTRVRVKSTQVTRFSHFTQFHPNSLPKIPFTCSNPINFHQKMCFSSKPESFVDLILSNDWSNEIENELEKLNPNLTHESVVYALMKLNRNPQKSLDFFKWVCVKKGFCPSFTPYYILLRTLACEAFMDEFWNIFSEMKKKGFYFYTNAFLTINGKLSFEKLNKESVEWKKRYKDMAELDCDKDVVKDVLSLISSNDWGEELEVLLRKKLEFPLNECFLSRVIAEMWEKPLKALKFFDWVGSCGGYEHDSVTYNAMARVLANNESVKEFWDFVKRMKTQGYYIDFYTYASSFKYLPNKDAVELFEHMMDGPYRPSGEHTASLLSKISSVSDTDLDLVYRVFNKFVGLGNAPTKSVYGGVHKALCNLGKFDEAKKIVEDLQKSGFKPDNFTYSAEIFGLCKFGRVDEACKVLERMEAEGCPPNIKTWTLLMNGLIEANRMDMALLCFETIRKKNVSPIPEMLSVLVKGYIAKNELLEAYKFFAELTNGGELKPSIGTCKFMIEKLAEAGKIGEAFHVLNLMKILRYRVYPQPVTAYIAKCGTVDDAKRLLMVLSPSDEASPTVYSKVVEAFYEQGRLADVRNLVLSSPLRVRQDKAIREMLGSNQAPSLS